MDPTLWFPAAVALVVVLIGGAIQWALQSRTLADASKTWVAQQRLEDVRRGDDRIADSLRWEEQAKADERRWREQQQFERERFMLQERRSLYARVIAEVRGVMPAVVELGELMLAHEPTEDAQLRVGERLEALRNTHAEIDLIGSAEVQSLVDAIVANILQAVRGLDVADESTRRSNFEFDWQEAIYRDLHALTSAGRDELLSNTIRS